MSRLSTVSGLSLSCSHGHVVYQDGKVSCGVKGCQCAIPLMHFVQELVRSGELSLDRLFQVGGERCYNTPSTIRRRINAGRTPRPFQVLESDVAALARLLQSHRQRDPHYLSEYVHALTVLAPQRVGDLLQKGDWAILGGVSQFLKLEDLAVLKPHNPKLVARWQAQYEASLWEDLDARLEAARRGEFVYGDEYRSEEERAHKVAISVLHVVVEGARSDRDRALTHLTTEDLTALESALEWCRVRKDVWNLSYLYWSLAAVFPERALEELKANWARIKEYLLRAQRNAHKLLKLQVEDTQLVGNGECVYFGDLQHLHAVVPELAREVVLAKDWLLLSAKLAHCRGRADGVYLVAHLEELASLQPLYQHLFPA